MEYDLLMVAEQSTNIMYTQPSCLWYDLIFMLSNTHKIKPLNKSGIINLNITHNTYIILSFCIGILINEEMCIVNYNSYIFIF